jgi:hypothetical protein
MKVSDADKRLLRRLLMTDAEQNERIDKGLAYTAEVEMIAAHRQAGIREGIEMAAKVAEERAQRYASWPGVHLLNAARHGEAERIATAIRALAGEVG